jgi:hypothetical protein
MRSEAGHQIDRDVMFPQYSIVITDLTWTACTKTWYLPRCRQLHLLPLLSCLQHLQFNPAHLAMNGEEVEVGPGV